MDCLAHRLLTRWPTFSIGLVQVSTPPPSPPPLDPEEAFLREGAPPDNLCPLSGALLTEAVIATDGITYQVCVCLCVCMFMYV